jgi:putative membrane protein
MTNKQPPQPNAASLIDADDPRVIWAAERTLLAWIRTGLAMMGFGFLVARFGLFLRELAAVKVTPDSHAQPSLSLWIGTGLVLLGVAVNLLAAWQHWQIERELYPGEQRRWPRITLALTVAVLLGAIGIAMAVYLITVG